MTEQLRQRITGIAFLLLLVMVFAPWVLSLFEVDSSVASTSAHDSLTSISPHESSVLPSGASKELDLHQKTKAKLLVSAAPLQSVQYQARIASFINPRNASELCRSLKQNGLACHIDSSQSWSRVYIGPMSGKEKCKMLARRLAKRQNIVVEKVII